MIEKLISRVFYARNAAHRQHWRTPSFAQHTALGDFYDGVISALDALVENYQGAFGLIGNVPAPDSDKSGNITKLLKDDAKWIEENHSAICKGNRAVANLIDGVTGVYQSTIYKLENLK